VLDFQLFLQPQLVSHNRQFQLRELFLWPQCDRYREHSLSDTFVCLETG